MPQINIRPIDKNLEMIFTGDKFSIPDHEQLIIDRYWDELLASGKNFKRGNIFVVKTIEETETKITVSVEMSDYAHYLASRHDVPGIPAFSIMHTSILIETNDGKIVFGRMNKTTSVPDKLQVAGGGITSDDLVDGRILGIERNARNELMEETGLDSTDKNIVRSMDLAYLKSGGSHGSFSAIYVARLAIDWDELLRLFEAHNEAIIRSGDTPEFSGLCFIDRRNTDLEAYLDKHGHEMDEFMPLLFRIYLGGTA